MSSNPIISVRNISKMYRLFHSPHERFIEALHPFNKKYHREFWALKDISCNIPKGSTMGIIGRNGSGKSTLLQIICSVLQPTTGSMTVNGKISALLELGSGFNLDFTGRENVMLNGVLMGFTKEEMKDRLPAIESFADIGEFFDQPIKIYSSGMQVRLAFAAAINVDPEILIVDEALAVGDAKFQNKCYRKFKEFQDECKTVLFVTHSMDAIVRHCHSALLLEKGSIVDMGEPKEIVNKYMELLHMGNLAANTPQLVKVVQKRHDKYNIIFYDNKYHAIAQSLGDVDLPKLVMEKEKLVEYQKSQKCHIADSLEAISRLLDHDSFQEQSTTAIAKKSELDKFFEEIHTEDRCIYRKNYNKNEYRYGDKRGEIIDYIVVCGEDFDSATVCSGDEVDIYYKIKYHQLVEFPMFGFSIKTVDGIVVYASNTILKGTVIQFTNESDIIIVKLTIKMDLHSGDYFIDLGCGEKHGEENLALDRRYSLFHINVWENNLFDGLVELESNLQEISRKTETEYNKVAR